MSKKITLIFDDNFDNISLLSFFPLNNLHKKSCYGKKDLVNVTEINAFKVFCDNSKNKLNGKNKQSWINTTKTPPEGYPNKEIFENLNTWHYHLEPYTTSNGNYNYIINENYNGDGAETMVHFCIEDDPLDEENKNIFVFLISTHNLNWEEIQDYVDGFYL